MLNSPEMDVQELKAQDASKRTNVEEEASKEVANTAKTNGKPSRTWKKWSEEETQQLLKGVAKHGAGKWKEICADPELKFRDRKPMDLKDRFRICVPGANKEKTENQSTAQLHDSSRQPQSHAAAPRADLVQTLGTQRSDIFTKPNPSADLAIALKSRTNQRIRKLWTEEEHQNLVRGFAKHGYQWTTIRNDIELNLAHRKATDIRDKFRSLFPQQYMDAESGPPASKKGTVNGPSKSALLPQPAANARLKISAPGDQWTTSNLTSFATLASKPPLHRADEPTKDTPDTLENPQEGSSAPNLTLPPLTLGDNDWDWDDNKLAPLLDWEEFGL
jgi:Myb-like DNA-binding domain